MTVIFFRGSNIASLNILVVAEEVREKVEFKVKQAAIIVFPELVEVSMPMRAVSSRSS